MLTTNMSATPHQNVETNQTDSIHAFLSPVVKFILIVDRYQSRAPSYAAILRLVRCSYRASKLNRFEFHVLKANIEWYSNVNHLNFPAESHSCISTLRVRRKIFAHIPCHLQCNTPVVTRVLNGINIERIRIRHIRADSAATANATNNTQHVTRSHVTSSSSLHCQIGMRKAHR